jgi:hypothetical protein
MDQVQRQKPTTQLLTALMLALRTLMPTWKNRMAMSAPNTSPLNLVNLSTIQTIAAAAAAAAAARAATLVENYACFNRAAQNTTQNM